MTKYIYHSEKTKTTCDECKKHDREVYYDIKDIPKLPIHPNCKCYIEIIEEKNKEDKNKKCDCSNRFEVLESNLNNVIENSDSLFKRTKKDILDCLIEIENKDSVDKEELKNKRDNLYVIQKRVEHIRKEAINLLLDIGMTKEFTFDNTYHAIKECKSDKELKEHSNDVSKLCEKINDLSEELKKIKEENKQQEKTLEKGVMTGGAAGVGKDAASPIEKVQKMYEKNIEFEQKMTKDFPNNAKNAIYEISNKPVSKFFTIAGANLQDSLNDFEAAKKNKHAFIINSRSEIKNKDINKVLDEVKVPKNSKGVYYDTNSEQSKAIFKTRKIQKIITEHKEKLKQNPNGHVEQIEFSKTVDLDAYFGLQNCKILNPHITTDEYFEATIIDYWDFNYRKLKEIENIKDIENNIANDINNWGYDKQQKGEAKNYFVIYSIREKITSGRG